MLSFEDRKALLSRVLQDYTPESLYEKLQSYPNFGPAIACSELTSYDYEITNTESFLTLEPRLIMTGLREQSVDFFIDLQLDYSELQEAA